MTTPEIKENSFLLSKDEMTLSEPVNMSNLRIIRDNFDILYKQNKLGRFVDAKSGYKQITDMKTIRTLLNDFYTQKIKTDDVNYKYAVGKKSGRMFSSSPSLQSISKKIRGCLSKGLYNDVDMVNCHIIILNKFCQDNKIPCPYLNSYILDREPKLKELMDTLDIDRDLAKTIPLSIINGGSGCVSIKGNDNEEYKISYKKGKEPDWLCGIRNEMLCAYTIFTSTPRGKKILDKVSKSKQWNIQGSVMNLLFCEEENKLLVCLYRYLKSLDIDVGTFVFDGLMIKQSSLYLSNIPIDTLLLHMEQEMLSKLGYTMKLSTKEFEDIDLTGLEIKQDIDLTDDGLSSVVLNTIDYKYHNKKDVFYIFDTDTKLWVEYNKDAILWGISKNVLTDYITNNMTNDSKKLIKALKMIKSTSKMTAIVKNIMKKIHQVDNSQFINKYFNNINGIFPIADGKTADLRTGLSRERTKEDYFTHTTNNKLLNPDETNTSFVKTYFSDVLSTTNDDYINYMIDTIGYMMTNENNLKRFYVMIGRKDTGKSLFVSLLMKVFGFLSGTSSDKVFKLKSSNSTHDTEVFSLEGKRLASVSELGENEKFNEVLMKKISGGDEINIRRAGSKINEEISFTSVLLLATNEVPSFHEEAFAGRMRAINFDKVFTINPEMKTNVLDNYNSFFTLFVQGASRYYKNNMNIVDCNEVIVSSRKLVNSKNPISMFWEDQDEYEFVNDIKKRVKKVDIWNSFVEKNNKGIMGRNKFYDMFMNLYKKELLDTTYGDGKMWSGIQPINKYKSVNDYDTTDDTKCKSIDISVQNIKVNQDDNVNNLLNIM